MTMRPIERGLGLPPDTTITMKPRGYHLLLRGAEGAARQGRQGARHPDVREGRHAAGRAGRSKPRGRSATQTLTEGYTRIAVRLAEGVLAPGARRDRRRDRPGRSAPCRGRPARRAHRSAGPGPTAGRAAPSSAPGRARWRRGNARCRAPGRDDAGSRVSRARVTSARMSCSRVSTSSLTPASSTVWPISGMPASASRARAARVTGASSRA